MRRTLLLALAGLMVLIRLTPRRELLQPLVEIMEQSVLPVVDEDGGRNVHRRDKYKTVLDATVFDDPGDLVSDPDELAPLLC